MPKVLLLIEDYPAARRAFKRRLTGQGYTIHEAESLQAARDLMATTPEVIDVILADTNLGDGDSPSLHAELVDIMTMHRIGWVSITGGATRAQREYFSDHGVTIVGKPIVQLEELVEAIEAAYQRG
jgi:CheY-like chemotaxis protein